MPTVDYSALWSEKDSARTFYVIDVATDTEKGNIIANSREEAESLLDNGIQRGDYPASSTLVEIVADGVLN